MRVIHLDLDNTLIYSYKRMLRSDADGPSVCGDSFPSCQAAFKEGAFKDGGRKISVEVYQGREISFVTGRTQKLLRRLKKRCVVIPTTTRTKEQYDRINLGTGVFEYALVCNGGLLLVNGVSDSAWYHHSRELISDCTGELRHAVTLLEREPLRKFELRFIEELFLFTKCNDPDTVIQRLKMRLDDRKVDVFRNGEKVYVVPKMLNKGVALRRFREYIGADEALAAGDSEFDVPMVEAADIGIVPKGFCRKYASTGNLREMKGEDIFSEEMLSWMEDYISR